MSCDLTERFLNLNPRPAIRVKTGDISAWTSNNTAELAIYINALVEAMLQIRKVVFDNRGIGNTTTGIKPFSIQQFANDTTGLLDALKIQKADVLG
ncbi:MAG: hypothetical protein WBZ20_09290, partial [Nitrososphaeraceae archaeon]